MHEFMVGDDGPGIAPEFHEKIFQIFQTLKARDNMESTGNRPNHCKENY
jgi:light-regulated signal transduction histidine kinase (bacteriophytochrome)